MLGVSGGIGKLDRFFNMVVVIMPAPVRVTLCDLLPQRPMLMRRPVCRVERVRVRAHAGAARGRERLVQRRQRDRCEQAENRGQHRHEHRRAFQHLTRASHACQLRAG